MTIPAHYGDGRSARRHAVTLTRSDDCLAVLGTQINATYPLAQLRLTEPFAHAAGMVYFDDGAHCEVDATDYPALAALVGQRASLVVRWQGHWRVALGAFVALVALIGASAMWGLPAAAGALTALLPDSADVRIGKLTRDAFTRQGLFKPSAITPAQQDQIRQVWQAVQPAQPRMPMTLLLRTMPAPFGPNALALPDGSVVLNDAMVALILGDEDAFGPVQAAALAGVLAHEIGHIEGRHSMRSVVRGSLTTAFAAFLFGDFSAVAAGAPAVLLGARHSRAMETEADAYAMAVLQTHHLPLAPLADLFLVMDHGKNSAQREAGWFDSATGYLSSHPDSGARAARLRAADAR
ncbi:M48 family metallopeptidase [Massilia sp. S19_KUP03_FR1]|uniref:M48 family metallopeptidase n=1 Tax=Massilia sp. S19_KUP03_FR1 TaxID=3025503 RepID=UPI002FCD278D